MKHDGLRHALMAATRDLHETLDTGIGGFRSAQDYARYVQGSLAFRQAIEQELARGDDAGWQVLPLAPSLRGDLTDLGLSEWPVPAAPALEGAAARAGAYYVLEGSALGARLLKRRAGELGLDQGRGARHLAAQTRDAGRWSRFLAWLDGSGAGAAEAGAAARSVFGLALAAYRLDATA
ncbi:biliverdin-producing heme oxygenase [Paracoccus yeei]|uniref:Biliverdin-producing heme oxygenase n=1 Tax=Paracoccus yeei TaxID=147645 RepID=A0A5P2QXX4_9RHOB|nr:biliverdin-producing heme oxygenase [Paracoccus yeei]QEU10730.1 biliverdin-producing heme oxygenase [Paracoccus yeei]